jgi:hypothetical protein
MKIKGENEIKTHKPAYMLDHKPTLFISVSWCYQIDG